MIDPRMPAEQFEQLIAPLYRQFAGFLPPNEMALHMSDRYRALGAYPPDALREAVDVALRVTTDARMPTIGWVREQCDGWLRARQGGMIAPPKIRSALCSFCAAERGRWDNGRSAVLHERRCQLFDPTARPLDVAVSQVA